MLTLGCGSSHEFKLQSFQNKIWKVWCLKCPVHHTLSQVYEEVCVEIVSLSAKCRAVLKVFFFFFNLSSAWFAWVCIFGNQKSKSQQE
jgi:hypothetical protein